MKSFNHAFTEKDEYKTPSCLVEMLIPYIAKFQSDFIKQHGRKAVIWCPFDTSESNYVKILKENGYEVIHSHISEGKDFFTEDPEYDIAISNPPFSKKLKIFQRFYEQDKPFVMLMNLMAINYQEIGNQFYKMGTDIQFLIPDKKVSFDGNTASFCSGYVCYKFLFKTEFCHLEDNNSRSFYKE